VKIMIVDDHDIFRQSLAMLLTQTSSHQVLAHYASMDQLFSDTNQDQPDCLLLDYHMPGETPIAALTRIASRWPAAYIVFLTGTRSVAVLKRIAASSVQGVAHKQDSAEAIVAMLDQLRLGQILISSSIKQQIEALEFGFSAKEFDVLYLLVQGKSPAQIADSLDLSQRTIEKHQENMMRKSGLNSVTQLIDLGHRLEILE
jgi:DNA-binding NarL/FixJ family response regulator